LSLSNTALRAWKLVELHPNECRSMSAFELLACMGNVSGAEP
jgi:hypothetical protein